MAGTQELNTGQYLTYLFVVLLPFIIHSLIYHVIPRDPIELKIFMRALFQGPPWALRGTCRLVSRKKVKRYKKTQVSMVCEGVKLKNKLRTYLYPFGMASFLVGCHVEFFIHQLGCLGRPPDCFTTLASKAGPPYNPYLSFDSDSFRIGIDNHVSFCMADSPHLFEDLRLINKGKQVDGIGAGLENEGTGTFVMRISNDDGKTREIKIPNSLYLPKLRQCLLLPQHWVQEAKAKRGNKGKTWMENYWDKCILLWDGGKFERSIPHDPSTNTPSFYSALASKTYCSFAATFEACKAEFYRREHVLQVPGLRERTPEELVANKNIHLRDAPVVDADKVREDDDTVKASNRSGDLPPSYAPSNQAVHQGPLTFDPSPPAAEDDNPTLAAADN